MLFPDPGEVTGPGILETGMWRRGGNDEKTVNMLLLARALHYEKGYTLGIVGISQNCP